MQSVLANYYFSLEEPLKSCLLSLRDYILAFDDQIDERWLYGMPFFYYKGKMFCYFWIQKKTGLPYIGIAEGGKIDHPALIQENRSRMKILVIDPEEDLPLSSIQTIFEIAKTYYSR